jgi:hypothetical protein
MSGHQVLGGIVLGVLLGAGGMYGVSTFMLGDRGECGGACGEGTVCVGERCELAPVEVDEPVVEEPEEPGKSKRRKGRRGKSGDGADAGEAEVLAGTGPALDDDSHVPRYDANADQSISMADGTGRLSDAEIDRELAKLDKAFQACVRDAAARVDELGSGTVKYSFGVDGRGKVTGVTASAPSNLQHGGIVPCVRVAVYGHRFPAFDGPTMKASSSFSVD